MDKSWMKRPKKMADGGVVDKPSLYSRMQDFLFGKKILQQAGQTGTAPTPTPSTTQPQQDISYVRRAAEEAAARMKKAKETSPDKTPKEFKCGGTVTPGTYGKSGRNR